VSSSAILAIAVPLLGALLGIGAVVVGARTTAHLSERHWIEQLRLNAYLDVTDAGRRYLYRAAEVGRGGSSSHQAEMDAFREAELQFRNAVTRVSFVGHAAVRRMAGQVLEYYSHDLGSHVRHLRGQHDEKDPVVQKGRDLLLELYDTARERLNLSEPLEDENRGARTPHSGEGHTPP
jgi:hypothetical protein